MLSCSSNSHHNPVFRISPKICKDGAYPKHNPCQTSEISMASPNNPFVIPISVGMGRNNITMQKEDIAQQKIVSYIYGPGIGGGIFWLLSAGRIFVENKHPNAVFDMANTKPSRYGVELPGVTKLRKIKRKTPME